MSEHLTRQQIHHELEDHNVPCKITLCCLRTQNGKTFVAIEKIRHTLLEEQENGDTRSVHFIFTMNTIKANGQVSARLKSIEQEFGAGSVWIVNSRKDYLGKFTHVNSMKEVEDVFKDLRYLNKRPRVIIACGNTKRFEDAHNLMDCLNVNCKEGLRKVRSFLYADEFHDKKVNTLENRTYIEKIHDMEIVQGIMLLSATPKRIFRSQGIWRQMRMINLRTFDPNPMYRGISDLLLSALEIDSENEQEIIGRCEELIPRDILAMAGYKGNKHPKFKKEERLVIGYIRYILQEHPDYFQAGKRIFVPAHVRKYTHFYIRKLIKEMCPNAAFILTNGDEKTLEIPTPGGRRTIQLTPQKKQQMNDDGESSDEDFPEESQDEELSETLARFYVKYELQNYPLFFTGFYLVSMGQTLIHERYGPFTHVILSHKDLDNDDIYQLLGRATARMGSKVKNPDGTMEWKPWSTICDTIVHCPTNTYNRAKAMEECARNMASFSDEIVTREDYEAPLHFIDNGAHLEDERMPEQRVAKTNKSAPPCIGGMIQCTTLEELFTHYRSLETEKDGKFNDGAKENPRDFIKGFQKTEDKRFIKCGIGKESKVQSTRDVEEYAKKCRSDIASKSVTSGLGANAYKLEKAKDMIHRVYISYDNIEDPFTIKYYLRWVKRL